MVTGGLDKAVTIAGEKVAADTPLSFTDAKQVSLTLMKKIDAGELKVLEGHSFTFTLYDASKNEIGSQSIQYDPANPAKPLRVVFNGLSQGATYYLREETDEGFLLTGMKAGGSALKEEDGYYRFTMPDDSNQGATWWPPTSICTPR